MALLAPIVIVLCGIYTMIFGVIVATVDNHWTPRLIGFLIFSLGWIGSCLGLALSFGIELP